MLQCFGPYPQVNRHSNSTLNSERLFEESVGGEQSHKCDSICAVFAFQDISGIELGKKNTGSLVMWIEKPIERFIYIGPVVVPSR